MTARVIAIDGPAYVGKSQIAQKVAKELGFEFINTGHMYRSVARLAMDRKISFEDEMAISSTPFEIYFENFRTKVQTNPSKPAEDWTEALDCVEIVEGASKVAKLLKVRKRLTEMQRNYVKRGQNIVMEGRDIGTVVFPDAEWKFFITASEEVRAQRLLKMTSSKEREKIDFLAAIEKIRQIDTADKNRSVAPLRQAEDAILYDNSDSPSAGKDAQEILRCIQMGRTKTPKFVKYGIHC